MSAGYGQHAICGPSPKLCTGPFNWPLSWCAGGTGSSPESTAALEQGIVLALHVALRAGQAGLIFVLGIPSLAIQELPAGKCSPEV